VTVVVLLIAGCTDRDTSVARNNSSGSDSSERGSDVASQAPLTASVVRTPRPPGLPAVAVGVAEHSQSLVVVDTTNGQIVRSLARSVDADGGLSDPHLSPDGFVYFQQSYPGDSGADLRRVSVDTPRDPEVLVRDGSGYTLSQDGQRVAYVPYVYTPTDPTPASVVVHEFRTGADRSWSVDPNAQPRVFINQMAWSPDNTTLAVGVDSYDQNTLSGGTALLDVASAAGTLPEPTLSELRPQVWLDRHRLVFNETHCCPANPIVLRQHDVQTGIETDLLNVTLTTSPAYVSTITLDDSGGWLLLAGTTSEATSTPYTAIFGPLDGDAKLIELADLGLMAADW
jgi:hypothetical protein